MANDKMMAQMSGKGGFIAALDQSGGSTPGALRLYGIPDTAYSGDAEMFRLVHQMRVRIMTAPAFTGDKVIATILFEGTMDGEVRGKPTPAFLWEERGVVPFVKVDKGLQPENDGVQLLRPMPELDAVCTRAAKLGVFGTKMRSVIEVMFKLTLPDVPDLYAPLVNDRRVARVVALSGGYTRADACKRLAANHGMIASFSRALAQDLRVSMSDTEFNAAVAESIDEIYRASTVKA